jgi:tRNA 2-thiouridine synthesizing protein A
MNAHSQVRTAARQQELPADHVIDARQLSCPLPMLTTRKSLDELRPGEVLKIISSDRGAPAFFESLSRQTGLQLVGWDQEGGDYSFFLRKQ